MDQFCMMMVQLQYLYEFWLADITHLCEQERRVQVCGHDESVVFSSVLGSGVADVSASIVDQYLQLGPK